MSPLTTNPDRSQTTTETRRGRKRAPLTQARAHATRERILNRALYAFARIGYEGASLTSDILQPAGVSVGSFYHQFDSKRDVFVELVQGTIVPSRKDAIGSLAENRPDDLSDAIRQLLTAMYDDVDANPDAWRIQYRSDELNDTELCELVVANLAAWDKVVADRLGEHASNNQHVAAATEITMSLVHGLVRSYLAADDVARAKLRGPQFDLAVDYIVGGVRAVVNA